jgi:hypothetical protein
VIFGACSFRVTVSTYKFLGYYGGSVEPRTISVPWMDSIVVNKTGEALKFSKFLQVKINRARLIALGYALSRKPSIGSVKDFMRIGFFLY